MVPQAGCPTCFATSTRRAAAQHARPWPRVTLASCTPPRAWSGMSSSSRGAATASSRSPWPRARPRSPRERRLLWRRRDPGPAAATGDLGAGPDAGPRRAGGPAGSSTPPRPCSGRGAQPTAPVRFGVRLRFRGQERRVVIRHCSGCQRELTTAAERKVGRCSTCPRRMTRATFGPCAPGAAPWRRRPRCRHTWSSPMRRSPRSRSGDRRRHRRSLVSGVGARKTLNVWRGSARRPRQADPDEAAEDHSINRLAA